MAATKSLIHLIDPPDVEFNHEFDGRCPWSILGLEPGSPDSEIKRMFKFLSSKCHPDVNKDGVEFFILLNQAQQVLLDPERRALFDEFGVFKSSTTQEKLKRLARTEIAAVFVKVFDANCGDAKTGVNLKVIAHADLMILVKESLAGSLKAAKDCIARDEQVIKGLLEASERFEVINKNKHNNAVKENIGNQFKAKARGVADGIETYRTNCLVFKKAADLCDDFEYRRDEEPKRDDDPFFAVRNFEL
mgnify:CR=1 FL=1